jgi:hypothetical protein
MKTKFQPKVTRTVPLKSAGWRTKAGFVLIETIVSVSVILLALPGVLTIATKGITIGTYAKNQMLAIYLAEEGIEYIQAKRDNNLLRIAKGDTIDWNDGFTPGPGEICKNKACIIKPENSIDNVIMKCSGTCSIGGATAPSAEYRLYVNPATGFYSHNAISPGQQATPFYRGVFVDGNPGSDEHVITSVVAWQAAGGIQKTISVKGYITNWFQ